MNLLQFPSPLPENLKVLRVGQAVIYIRIKKHHSECEAEG